MLQIKKNDQNLLNKSLADVRFVRPILHFLDSDLNYRQNHAYKENKKKREFSLEDALIDSSDRLFLINTSIIKFD